MGGGAYKSGGLLSAVYGPAYEQALRGALAVGREKEGELATTSVEFENSYFEKGCRKNVSWAMEANAPFQHLTPHTSTFPSNALPCKTFFSFFFNFSGEP